MIGGTSRLEQRLDALLVDPGRPRPFSVWLEVWGLLVLLGFRYAWPLTVRGLLAGAVALELWSGRLIEGAIVLGFFLIYLLQLPLIVGIARGERDLRRSRRER